jgi:uncharacterized protein (TIGR02217 family)
MGFAPTFDNVELDREICREATGGPEGMTTVQIGGNAKEQRNIEWPMSRGNWSVLWVARSDETKFRNLISFFEARKWRGYGFRFFDWSDYDDWGNGLVLLDTSINKYRLYKRYDDALRPVDRPIYAPIDGTVALDGVANATVFDIDYQTGIIDAATSAGTWTGQFNKPARFGTDRMEFKITPDKNVVWNGVQIIELIS